MPRPLFDREAARSTARWQPALPPAVADLDVELDRIAKLGVEDLRAVWRERRGQEPPEALSKDLIARALAHWLQEKCLGGTRAPSAKVPRLDFGEGRRARAAREGRLRHRPRASFMRSWSFPTVSCGRGRSMRASRPSP
jgi:hypothetical protein